MVLEEYEIVKIGLHGRRFATLAINGVRLAIEESWYGGKPFAVGFTIVQMMRVFSPRFRDNGYYGSSKEQSDIEKRVLSCKHGSVGRETRRTETTLAAANDSKLHSETVDSSLSAGAMSRAPEMEADDYESEK
ncbi:hypothetical protein HZH68_011508 [Vespula germanica]|uniref:Uncharacterized protein n=1 Tax=Vespula germanica TaxID=30212 RepID=A0A834N094_VESGE|nr:hypothetical protein HZH68_011508 [Vespula germanica]